MWQQGAAAAYTNNISLCSRKDTSREESSVDMKIFIVLKDLHAELPGLTMLDFSGYLNDKIWNIQNKVWNIWKHDGLLYCVRLVPCLETW